MKKEYAIGIDLGGTSVKYALIDNEGVFHFQGKLPSNAHTYLLMLSSPNWSQPYRRCKLLHSNSM